MQKPILIEGPPGCGKTELAKAVTLALEQNWRGCNAIRVSTRRRRSAGSIRLCSSFSSRPNPTSSEPDGSPSELACTP
jgi:hypothetical protein